MLARFAALDLGMEKIGGLHDELPRFLSVAGEGLLGGVEKLDEDRGGHVGPLRPHERVVAALRQVLAVAGRDGRVARDWLSGWWGGGL